MSQNDFNIANQGFPSFRSDLNDALQSLASNNAGATEPATTYANQWWYDTTTSLLKLRNEANTDWAAPTFDGLTVNGPFTSLGIDDNAAATAVTIDASGNVGIGTDTPTFSSVTFTGAHIHGQNGTALRLTNFGQGQLATDGFDIQHDSGGDTFFVNRDSGNLRHYTGGSERLRIDASGNVLLGKTASDTATAGITVFSSGYLATTVTQGTTNVGSVAQFRRNSTDGSIVNFYKDGTTVGSIGTAFSSTYIAGTNYGLRFYSVGVLPCDTGGNAADNIMDLGTINTRFDDVYATNGTIQTSDRNEKEAIASLTPAEMLVAARLSSSFKNFKWKDAVAEKGLDAARMHSGIIAQDVQDAFAAEGLDASDYAMFISGTWWEAQTDVPAVEAVAEVVDEEGNVVTEAVEAKDAYTRTDTYETLEEAPEGATERTRLGVRYPELLAFVAAYNDQRFLAIESRLAALEAI